MPDSVGAGGFPNNINIGHEHLDISTGFKRTRIGYERFLMIGRVGGWSEWL